MSKWVNSSKRERSQKLLRLLLYIMPVAMYFSYWPVMRLGSDSAMNFELSVPLVWLVVFDVVAGVMLIREYWGRLAGEILGKWAWWLFLVFATASVFWSLNFTRGILTCGVMWLIAIAVFAVVELRGMFDAKFWRAWWRWFFGAGLVACVWCVAQCIMDASGVGREVTQMCAGCVSASFGFPRPNGWAIEPQFMGNLLIAPAIAALYMWSTGPAGPCPPPRRLRSAGVPLQVRRPSTILIIGLIYVATIFLTMSRGAIYALVIGLIFLTAFEVAKTKKRLVQGRRMVAMWLMVVATFVGTLCLQGALAEMAPTKEGFMETPAKVVHQLSLGLIDLRGKGAESEATGESELENGGAEAELWGEAKGAESEKTTALELGDNRGEAVFDGYVAESTDVRLKLTGAAMEVWRKDAATVIFGVGLGGAGQALFDAGMNPSPKEIVQNEYASILLETGVVGAVLFAVLVGLVVVTAVRKSRFPGLVLAVVVAYGVSVCFFSGLPNAMHIVLWVGMMMVAGVFRVGGDVRRTYTHHSGDC